MAILKFAFFAAAAAAAFVAAAVDVDVDVDAPALSPAYASVYFPAPVFPRSQQCSSPPPCLPGLSLLLLLYLLPLLSMLIGVIADLIAASCRMISAIAVDKSGARVLTGSLDYTVRPFYFSILQRIWERRICCLAVKGDWFECWGA